MANPWLLRVSRRWIALPFVFVISAGLAKDAAHRASPRLTAAPARESAAVGLSCRLDRGSFTNGSRERDEIALSFDVCPTSHKPPFAPELIAYLQQARVPATFFVAGQWARSNPDDLKILDQTPFFEIALHGDYHRHLAPGQPEAIRAEIEGGRQTLVQLGAHPRPLFRPPFGDAPPELAAVSRAEGVLPVLWDAGLGDPDPNRTAPVMERDAFRWVQAGSIIVLHANGGGVATAELVRQLVPALRKRGYIFVHVGDLASQCGLTPADVQVRASAP
jgi:peptidoglycan/xylan/chitin deacetylase (PgdA/CDA1 family)